MFILSLVKELFITYICLLCSEIGFQGKCFGNNLAYFSGVIFIFRMQLLFSKFNQLLNHMSIIFWS